MLRKLRYLVLFLLMITVARGGTTQIPAGGAINDLHEFCSQSKGFNLLGKFDVSWSNNGYTEKEFSVIHELGFNFVRLPLDFRTYTQYGNWNVFKEMELTQIDKAVEWGRKYGVHICINLHRAPGYCVNSATLPVSQQLDLWTDSVAQAAFVNHWVMFANRYKEIPADILSFNLINEPSKVEEDVYVEIMKRAIDSIHSVTPERVVFVDGLNYARDIIVSLKDEPNIAQALHSYDPFQLTHYKAGWVNGSSEWPVPIWPMHWVSTYLYGPWKSEFKSPLVLQGDFPEGTEITVNVRQVSTESTLRIKADARIIYSKKFVCSADPGDDFTKVVQTEWGYQNISNKDYSVTLTEPAGGLTFENASGDWMTINTIIIKNEDDSTTYNLSDGSWGKKQATYHVDDSGALKTPDGKDLLPFEDYRKNFALAREHNIPIMIQEFGVHNQTPHVVTIAFLTDLSSFFQENSMGWALWNLTGSFGIFNSNRSDCTYEPYQGYKLDRKMLNALAPADPTRSEIQLMNNAFKVFPSPAVNQLYIYSDALQGTTLFKIWDITGNLIFSDKMEAIPSELIRVDISGFKSGVYIVSAKNNGTVLSRKFLVNK